MNIMLHNMEGTKEHAGGKTIDIAPVFRNLAGVEQKEETKSVLQQLLEPKGLEEGQKDAEKAAEIAKKIARGDHVSPEEKKFLMETDPRLAQMAELARKEGERIRHALSQASSKKEQQSVIQQAYQMVLQVSKKNEEFGMLLGEAVKAAVKESRKKMDFQKEVLDEGEFQKEIPAENTAFSEEDGQEQLLKQFLPDEWMSMLDCRG